MTTNTQEIKDLEKKITHLDAVYHSGIAEVSDPVYEAYKSRLRKLDPHNALLDNVGTKPEETGEFEKFKHTEILGSLNKCNTPDEFRKWGAQYVPNLDFVVTSKLDGFSVYLKYTDGELELAASRGNGEIAEIITRNVVKMKNVPLKLREKLSFGVRGEVVITKDVFEKHFAIAEYKNSRNAAAGVARKHDGAMCEYLELLVYKTYGLEFERYTDELQFLSKMGFVIPEYNRFDSAEKCIEFKENFQTNVRDKYEVDVDGLVYVNNDIALLAKYGYSNNGKNPRAAIAYKFENEGGVAVVESIEWSPGSLGRITPTANFTPVEIDGAEITRCTLHNPAFIANLGLKIGATVLVERGGAVIPLIAEVIEDGNEEIVVPTNCPACNSKLAMDGENLHCYNYDCPAQVVGRVANWISSLNILEFGDKLIERIVESKLVETPADLYTLSVEDIASLERMGVKSATKCLQNLHANKELPLEVFLGSLSIPMIAVSTVKIATKAGLDTLDKLMNASVEDFEAIKGFGGAKARAFVDGVKHNRRLIEQLLKNGVSIMKAKTETKTVVNVGGGKLAGKSIVFTGSMSRPRKELQEIVEANGGTNASAVRKGTSYLVMADPDSTTVKAKSARELGTQVISEEDFMDMVS